MSDKKVYMIKNLSYNSERESPKVMFVIDPQSYPNPDRMDLVNVILCHVVDSIGLKPGELISDKLIIEQIV